MARSPDMNTNNQYVKYYIEAIVNSQNVSNNTSSVTVRVWAYRTNTGFETYGNGTVYCKIDGSTYTASITTSQKITNTPIKLFERTVTVSHNADGTKTLVMEAKIDIPAIISSNYQSWTYALTTIPRKSSFSASSSVNFGSTLSISISRASSNFTHRLRFVSSAYSVTITTNATTSYSWTVPNNAMNNIPNATSISGTLYCDTYSGSTLIGTSSRSLTLKVPSSVVPTLTSASHQEHVTSVANAIGSYVQSKSRITMTANGASGTYGSTINRYEFSIDGKTYAGTARSRTSDIINGSGTLTVRARVRDSRNRWSSWVSTTITVLAYKNPSSTHFTLTRVNADGTSNPMGNYARITSTISWTSLGSKNTTTLTLKRRLRGATTWTTIRTINAGASGSYSLNRIEGVFSELSSYDILLEVKDVFTTTTVQATLSTGQATMSWGRTGIGIGKIYERGALDIQGIVYVDYGKIAIQPRTIDDAEALAITGGHINHGYIGFYRTHTTDFSNRDAYVGYGSSQSSIFTILNRAGSIRINGEGNSLFLDASNQVQVNGNSFQVNSGATFTGAISVENNIHSHHALYFGAINQSDRSYMTVSGGFARWYPKHNETSHVRVRQSDGQFALNQSGSWRHIFNADGSKAGGSIEIDGTVYGMSPIDSPQVLLEYIEFDIPLSEQGTKVYIDEIFLKSINYQFAVFANNGRIIEKGTDYFIIQGEGLADVRIVGERVGYENAFYSNMYDYEDEGEI